MAKEDLFDKFGDFLNKSTRSLKDRLTLDQTDLLRAVDDYDPQEVERALNAKVDPNKDDGIGRYALPIACDNNHALIVRLLLSAGANPELTGRDGQPPLFKAVYWENAEIVMMLLKAGADIHQPNREGITPFEEAKRNEYNKILQLLEGHYDNKRSKQVAADRARHEVLKAEAKKARAEQAAQKEAAIKKEQERQIEESRKKYKTAGGDDQLALIQAIRKEDKESAALFIKQLDDLNYVAESTGTTPLMSSILNKQGEITKLLIDSGADCFQYVPKYLHSPFTYAVAQDYYKLVQLMLADINEGIKELLNDPDQLLSPQFMAYKNPKMLNLLLENGADPFFGGKDTPAPIVKAIEKASIAILPVLVRNKVDLNGTANGKTLLEWAVIHQRQDWLIGLIKEGADIDRKDDEGRTPLFLAVEENQPEFVAILVEENADTTLPNAVGQTALEMAMEMNEREKIIQILEEG